MLGGCGDAHLEGRGWACGCHVWPRDGVGKPPGQTREGRGAPAGLAAWSCAPPVCVAAPAGFLPDSLPHSRDAAAAGLERQEAGCCSTRGTCFSLPRKTQLLTLACLHPHQLFVAGRPRGAEVPRVSS